MTDDASMTIPRERLLRVADTLGSLAGGLDDPEQLMIPLDADDDFALDLVWAVLTGGKLGRLYRRLVVDGGLATSVSTNNDARVEGGAFWLYAEAVQGVAPEALEAAIDAFEGELEPLRRFILPGGTRAAAGFHQARTVCRRAERRAVSLDRADPLAATALGYLNRLSDLLFVLARLENARDGCGDVEWEG